MRKSVTLLIFLSVISLISCEKDERKEFTSDSSFQAIKNENEWTSTCSWANYSITDKSFVIAGSKSNSVYYQDEKLHFAFKASDISKSNTVTNFYAEWNFIVGGDAISDTYLIDSTYNNLLTINLLDTTNKLISGTFIIKLIRDKFRSDLGETMLYKNGTFNLKYKDIE